MDKLNTLLAAMVALAITTPFVMSYAEYQIQPVQMEVSGTQEVSQEVYRAIYGVALDCNIKNELRTALDDKKITYDEATTFYEICEAQVLDNATQPFERGKVQQELNYTKTGGVLM